MLVFPLKEEGDSSHVNQAYDKFVSKNDKSLASSYLSVLHSMKSVKKGIIYQRGIIHVCIKCIHCTQPAIWTSSFFACNLDTHTQVPFIEWCKNIQPFPYSGETFKMKNVKDDIFLLLPYFWHGMLPVQIKVV